MLIFRGVIQEEITEKVLRGSGYLGYVDSNQGYNPYKWVICPLTRVINLAYNQLPTVSWTSKYILLRPSSIRQSPELVRHTTKIWALLTTGYPKWWALGEVAPEKIWPFFGIYVKFLGCYSLHLKMDGWNTFSFPFGSLPGYRAFCC